MNAQYGGKILRHDNLKLYEEFMWETKVAVFIEKYKTTMEKH